MNKNIIIYFLYLFCITLYAVENKNTFIPISKKIQSNVEIYTLQNKQSSEIIEILKNITDIKITGLDNKIILKGSKDEISKVIDVIKKIDSKKSQILIKITIIDTSKNLFDALGFKWKFNGTELIKNISGGNFSFSKLLQNSSDILGVNIEALKENGDINIKAIPSILVLDNEHGEFKITDEILVGFTNNSKSEVQTPITKEAGIIIDVKPKIKGEIFSKYVEINLKIEISNFKIKGSKKKNTINTVVNVLNGSSVFIGGNTQIQKEESKQKVPVLSEIPFIGALFTYTSSSNVEREMYIEVEAIVQ
ncbi:type II secretion system protein GspD [Caviibacter abscessus]|uniref:type II secretion system protein GspD n=1 Tax=Caviibacter abscessus TaxID=1766719 RepID=UPI000839655A|nr:hypothetical protein [Caviibacter abscessus]